jgi:hypothetical protein
MNSFSDSETQTWQTIKTLEGRSVSNLSILAYEHHGELSREDTPLQMSFESGEVLLLDGMSNGEALRANLTAWRDPFAGNLTPENQAFVDNHGKWKLQDVSMIEPYHALIGQALKRINPIVNQFGTLSGVQLGFDQAKLYFIVEFDECHILSEQESQRLAEKGFRVVA